MTPTESIEKLRELQERIITAAWLDWRASDVEEKFAPDGDDTP